jgi:hypothetical protein
VQHERATLEAGRGLQNREPGHSQGRERELPLPDSLRHVALSSSSRDLDREPFASLEAATFRAKARVLRRCG